MVATAGLSLTSDPMGKMFQNTSLTVHECSLDGPLENFGFCSDMKFKMTAMTELSFTLNLMGKCFKTLLY
jgi:hypothetical protein